MKKIILLSAFIVGISAGVHAQEHSRIKLSLNSDFFPEFRIHEAEYTPSSAYGFQLSFYDMYYTRLKYSFHYARGYHRSVSYSAGLSAGYVISLSDRFSLTSGLGVMEYKMKDRTCQISFRSIMNTLFDVYEPCSDDSHVSFNPFLTAELKISEPFSILIQANYRAMLSNVRYLEETYTESRPNGGTIEHEIYETKNSFYGAGLGIGIALRINFF